VNGVFTDGIDYYFLRLDNGVLYHSCSIDSYAEVFALLEVALTGASVFVQEVVLLITKTSELDTSIGGTVTETSTTTTRRIVSQGESSNTTRRLEFSDDAIDLKDEVNIATKKISDVHVAVDASLHEKPRSKDKMKAKNVRDHLPHASKKIAALPKPDLTQQKRKREILYDSDPSPVLNPEKSANDIRSPRAKKQLLNPQGKVRALKQLRKGV